MFGKGYFGTGYFGFGYFGGGIGDVVVPPEADVAEPVHPVGSLPVASFEEPVIAGNEDLLRLNTSAVIDLVYLLELRPFAPAGTTLPS